MRNLDPSPASLPGLGWSLESGVLRNMTTLVRGEYVDASPWPHAIVTGLFPEDLIDKAAQESLAIPAARVSRTHDRNQIKEETPDGAGPAMTEILDQLASPAFLEFLGSVTGIEGLLADPLHSWAGLHRTPPGGFTMIHRDFRKHPVSGLHHRVNVLVYLNREWPEEYGGALQLWPSDMRSDHKVIRPLANTMVIWETHDQTLHGFPDPVACPPGDARLALASYYYTVAPRVEKVPRRRGVYARRPQDGFFVGRRRPVSVIRENTPRSIKPLAGRLHRAVRSGVRKVRGLF